MKNNLSVREIQESDIPLIIDYWFNADKLFLLNMGVDVNKMPCKEEWQNMLLEQISQPYKNKNSYCIIWQVNGTAVGHSNVNKIIFKEEAYMHLHLWKNEFRKMGYGTQLVKMALPWFFKNLSLKILYCEPYAGFLNFEQKVNLWKLSYENFKNLN